MLNRLKELNLEGKKVIAIDIGQHTVKIIAGKKNENSIELTHAVSFPTPSDSCENGRITNTEVLKNSIKNKLKLLNIKGSKTLCSVESSDIITREIIVPFSTDKEIEKMLDYQIHKKMPIEIDNYMILSKVLDNKLDRMGNLKVHALATAVPNDIVYGYYDLIKSMNLKPIVFDTQSNVLDKLIGSEFIINEDNSVKETSFGVIEIGYGHINISIFKDSKYIFSRSLKTGAKTIDNNLMHSLNVSKEEAETYKFGIQDLTKSFNDEEVLYEDKSIEMTVLHIVQSTIDLWLKSIDRVMNYYTTQSIDNQIDKIYIFGGTTKINGLDRYIQQSYNIPVNRINGLQNVSCNFYEGDNELASYINALGTMIRK